MSTRVPSGPTIAVAMKWVPLHVERDAVAIGGDLTIRQGPSLEFVIP